MTCEDGARFLLPRGDCAMLPIVHSTAEELAQYLWHRITTVRFLKCMDVGTVGLWVALVPKSSPTEPRYTHTCTHDRRSASTGCWPAGSTRCRSSSLRRPSRRAPTRGGSRRGRSRCVRLSYMCASKCCVYVSMLIFIHIPQRDTDNDDSWRTWPPPPRPPRRQGRRRPPSPASARTRAHQILRARAYT